MAQPVVVTHSHGSRSDDATQLEYSCHAETHWLMEWIDTKICTLDYVMGDYHYAYGFLVPCARESLQNVYSLLVFLQLSTAEVSARIFKQNTLKDACLCPRCAWYGNKIKLNIYTFFVKTFINFRQDFSP